MQRKCCRPLHGPSQSFQAGSVQSQLIWDKILDSAVDLVFMQVVEDSGLKEPRLTRHPKVQQVIKDLFNSKAPNRDIKPHEIVAYGAAVQAAIVSGQCGQVLLLLNMTPLTPGFKLSEE